MTPEAFIAFARCLPEPMALTDERGRVLASNASARDFVIPLRTGTAVCDLSPDGPRLREWLAACRDARGLLKTTVPLRRDDGTLVDVRIEATSLAVGEAGDAPPSLLLRFRSRASGAQEQALHIAEARYRELFSNAVHGICRCHVDGTIVEGNPALAAMLGHASPESLVGIRLGADIYEEPEAFLTLVDRIRHAGRALSVDANWRRRNGDPLGVRLSGRFETGGSPDGVIELLVEDATERRTLEAQLAHTTKMESIGRLAGGIAHDFNNLLTAILGYVDLMQGSLSEQDPIARHALQIRRSAERASLLTRQLLAFSRKQFLQPRVIDLNAVVEESSQMLRRLISEHIELSASLDPRLLRVKVDPAQLQQVLMNLAVNARDAMPKGGTLGIVTANVDLPARALGGAPDFEAGPYVMLAVSDTGIGMDTNTRARVFEPFFTTKRIGEGTGLGLSTVYGIVSQSGGHIQVDSERGRGSRFTIYFPAVSDAAEAPRPETVLTDGPIGRETLLLVEDDPMVRSLAIEALKLKGYRVLDAGDGREALRLAQGAGDIDLLITDVVMPRMTGRELADKLRMTAPLLRVLFMSGYPASLGEQLGRNVDLLEKPFTSLTLVSRVRQALDRDVRAFPLKRA
jgi:two-component system, cell cycle sensor histidine kinase and response regulator CckA